MFVFCFVCVWSFIFAYRFYEFGNQATYNDQAAQWITCAMVTQPSLAAQGINIECGVRPYPSRTLWLGVQTMVAGQGIFLTIVYTYMDNFTLWFDLIVKFLGSCGLIVLNEEQKKAIVMKSNLTGTDVTETTGSATNTNDGHGHNDIELPENVYFEGRVAQKSIFQPDGRVIPSKSFAAQEIAAKTPVNNNRTSSAQPASNFQLTTSPVFGRAIGQSVFQQPDGRIVPSQSFAVQESDNPSLSPKSGNGIHNLPFPKKNNF